jgi:hypothetical protein
LSNFGEGAARKKWLRAVKFTGVLPYALVNSPAQRLLLGQKNG